MATATATKKLRIVKTEYGSDVGPAGRMTRSIQTRYRVGDRVLMTASDDPASEPSDRSMGVPGVIRRIGICDPNDGDRTALYFDVKLDDGGWEDASEDEIAPFAAVEAWLRLKLGAQMVEPAIRNLLRAKA